MRRRMRRHLPKPHSSWVATRRGLTKPVSSSPPFKTVRTTFMVYGLAPSVPLRDRTKRSFTFLQLHRYPPVYSLRVRWVPLLRSFRRLRAFALEMFFPVCPAFLGSDYYAPSDSCEDIGHFVGLSLTYSPLPLAFLTGLPCSQERTQTECCRWRVAERPVPALGLPRLPPG